MIFGNSTFYLLIEDHTLPQNDSYGCFHAQPRSICFLEGGRAACADSGSLVRLM